MRKQAFRRGFACMILAAALFTGERPTSAEIYRWKDVDGTVRYSNTKPGESAEILDVIPTRRVPLVEAQDGTVYYLNVPERIDQLNLPPDMLDELLKPAPAPKAETPASAAKESDAADMAEILKRLTDLESSLQREIAARQKWERAYEEIRSDAKRLEQENTALTRTLDNTRSTLDALLTRFDVMEFRVDRAGQDKQHSLQRVIDLQARKLSEQQGQIAALSQQIEAMRQWQTAFIEAQQNAAARSGRSFLSQVPSLTGLLAAAMSREMADEPAAALLISRLSSESAATSGRIMVVPRHK